MLTDGSSPDVVVCMDACFTQKQYKGKYSAKDAPRQHPDTIFIPQAEVDAMRAVYEARCGSSATTAPPPSTEHDSVEAGLKVPNSILDDCHKSFFAADERREKADPPMFADTGLMAMLCRHDRVIWLTNMNTAGERRYYALALLTKLFEHLGPYATVGVLYDIGCQLHRTCVKWGFLSEFLHRLTFGISVFHAYGHQWPCQIIYHPRKCIGFGLCDGEGCERFWSSIKKLIANLRVSGVSVVAMF